MFFLFILITLFESSVNVLQAFIENAPALVIVMAFFVCWIVCWLPVATISAILLNWQPFKPLQPEQKMPLLVSLYLLAPLIVWGVLWLTNKSFLDYGFVGNFSTLGFLALGFVLGVVSLAIVFSGQLGLGWCSFEKSNLKLLLPILLPIFLIALLVGGIEELVFRGFLFTELAQDYPVWLAAAISSLIFALLHLVWEQRETAPQLPGLWLMGIVLVLARFASGGNLGLAWGLHAGWIWAIATIDTAELITYTGIVSDWFTGKHKKPLAGLAGIICVLVTGVIIWFNS
ncbi:MULTISPECIES: type II CAAX endopeptidase family protein [unclassified Nostoc]|uniref:CPBP family intramembrane glutamic endopeptidase n=1 Tax=unclassified Nostoc TaxID=2593658 RepID=UPI002AD50710|nr:type II CAAX endopeptidase family protein [Nostoc sp. DedQUE03]MDZ7970916.1 type II CAAX endopeptidase family protein [Nostoc sp. DedQUE03]MDZ8045874.1 type II CAAX endopeptidase family protein [Nostoc sp. DedQUE02]